MNKNYNQQHPNSAKLSIKGLVLRNMDGFGQQYRRSFETQMNNDNLFNLRTIINTYATAAGYGGLPAIVNNPFDPANTVPLMHNFVKPQVESVPVDLPFAGLSGWESPVASFVLEVDVEYYMGSTSTYLIAGYTDRPVNGNEELNGDMTMVVNSVFEYRDVRMHSPFPRLVSAAQVLADERYHGVDNDPMHRMRPYDTMSTVTRLADPMLGSMVGMTTVDTRTIQNGTPSLSDYSDNDASCWVEHILKAGEAGKREADMTDRHGVLDMYHAAAREARTVDARHNAFFVAISRLGEGTLTSNFTLKQLGQIDATFIQRTTISTPKDEVVDNLFYASLEGQDADTVAAHYLVNSIPAIMAKWGLRTMHFGARNFRTPSQLTVIEASPVYGRLDPSQVQGFLDEVRVRAFDSMSNNNQRSYMFGGQFDLFGKSTFALEFGKDGARHYQVPTFANARFSPLVTRDTQLLDANGENFVKLFESMRRNEPVFPSSAVQDHPIDTLPDHLLTPEQLDEKYNPDGDGEHPELPRQMWRDAVKGEDTISGYWVWLSHKLISRLEGSS